MDERPHPKADGGSQDWFGPRAETDRSDDTQAVSSPPRVAEPELPKGTTVDRYMIVEKIGAGGMGVVYAAYDSMLNRKVAIKLLRIDHAEQDRMRLLREAQAMAQLSHPNVLPIYDVGTWKEEIFLATEFVDGHTLKEWIKGKHTWREVLEVFVDAGKGLAAAHDQGFIHRDFKPGNVLLDEKRRVRVMDFGLARRVDSEDDPGQVPSDADEVTGDQTPALLTGDLTGVGSAMGTPAYMAPEQRAGEEVDARADQFSYCVALYEALFGERPFPGRGKALARAVQEGRIRIPTKTSVPTAIRRAVLRGLSRDPKRRWPSMEALLAVLERRMARRRFTAATAAVTFAIAAVSGLAYGKYSGANAALCSGAEEKLAGVWDEHEREAVRKAFSDTRAVYASAAWDRVDSLLSHYASTWSAAHRESCEATQVRREQSESMMDLKMACLDRRLWELDALVGTLAHADATTVQNAARAATGLGSVQDCLDAQLLQSDIEPPAPAIAQQVAEMRRNIAEVKALQLTGQYPKAVELGRTVLGAAEALDYPPILAEISFRLGGLLSQAGTVEESEKLLKQALLLAEEQRMDEVMTSARITLVSLYAFNAKSKEEIELWASLARAGIERMRGDLVLELDLSNNVGIAWMQSGRYQEALEQFENSLTVVDKIHGKYPQGSPEYLEATRIRAATENNLGGTYHYLGQYPKARKHYTEAVELMAESYGDYHPNWASSMANLGMMLQSVGELDAAVDALLQAKQVYERALGSSHPHYASVLVKLADVELSRNAPDKAVPLFQQAIGVYEQAFRAAHPQTFQAIEGLGRALLAQEDYEAARNAFLRSRDIATEVAGKDPRGVVASLYGLARIDEKLGNLKSAKDQFETVIERLEAGLGEDHPSLSEPLIHLAQIQRRQGRLEAAHANLERALRVRSLQPGRPESLATIQFALAQLAADRGNIDEALTLADKAQRGFRQAGPNAADHLSKLVDWKRSVIRGLGRPVQRSSSVP